MGFMVWALWYGLYGMGFMVWALWYGLYGMGFMVWVLFFYFPEGKNTELSADADALPGYYAAFAKRSKTGEWSFRRPRCDRPTIHIPRVLVEQNIPLDALIS
jgi:hypothetical protein